MFELIDELLPYAIALGGEFEVHEPVPSKSKKPVFKTLSVPAAYYVDHKVRQSANSMAHFIASLMGGRVVSTKRPSSSKVQTRWTVADERTGAFLSFFAPNENEVRRLACMASSETVESKLGAFETAQMKLALARKRRMSAIVAERLANERVWPPAAGSLEAEALLLSKTGMEFMSYRGRISPPRRSSQNAFEKKLRDPSLHLSELSQEKLEDPDSYPVGSKAMWAAFCLTTDASDSPIHSFQWVYCPPENDGGPSKKRP